jgi:hypothetical protein
MSLGSSPDPHQGAQALDALMPALLAIPAEDLTPSLMSTSTLHQEANDLLDLCRQPATLAKLQGVKHGGSVEALAVASEASREAQARWILVRDAAKPQAQREREAAGYRLRADFFSACDLHLDGVEGVDAALSNLREGSGVPDLIADLEALALLGQQHREALEGDETFPIGDKLEEARALARELRLGLSQFRNPGTQLEARDLRDRARVHLERAVATVRKAGRHAFRDDAKMLPRFSSAYHRRRNAPKPSSPTNPTA